MLSTASFSDLLATVRSSCQVPAGVKPQKRKRCRQSSSSVVVTKREKLGNEKLSFVPEEIWQHVLSFVDGDDLTRLLQTSSFFNKFISSSMCEKIWHQRCISSSIRQLVYKVGESPKTWFKSYQAAKSNSVVAVPLCESAVDYIMEKPGAYSLLSVSALADAMRSKGEDQFPWGDDSQKVIEHAMNIDDQFLKSQDKALLPACCIALYQGFQFLFISCTNFEFAEGSNLVPVTAHHFHFQTENAEKQNFYRKKSEGIVIVPTAFLTKFLGQDFFIPETQDEGERHLLVNSSFTAEASTPHFQPDPVQAFKMYKLPTLATMIQLYTVGRISRSCNGKRACVPEPKDTIPYVYEPRYQWPWYIRMGSFPNDPNLYLALSLLEEESDATNWLSSSSE